MKIELEPGRYVVAVSGGVDSMALLYALQQRPDMELVVAHFDHGIRPDSPKDSQLVRKVATGYGLRFVVESGRLGSGASEAVARAARYEFLGRVKTTHGADAIVTAHHQDDVLETAIINLLRGTGRKGLSSLRSTDEIKRPLLDVSKQTIRGYAEHHSLKWREDSTNKDDSYLRNYVRLRILPRLSQAEKNSLLEILSHAAKTNEQLDIELLRLLPAGAESLKRKEIIGLSHAAGRELVAAWLRSNGVRNFDRTTLERLVVAAKTSPAGKHLDVVNRITMRVGKTDLALEHIER